MRYVPESNCFSFLAIYHPVRHKFNPLFFRRTAPCMPLIQKAVIHVGAGHARDCFFVRGYDKLLSGHPHGPLLQMDQLYRKV